MLAVYSELYTSHVGFLHTCEHIRYVRSPGMYVASFLLNPECGPQVVPTMR